MMNYKYANDWIGWQFSVEMELQVKVSNMTGYEQNYNPQFGFSAVLCVYVQKLEQSVSWLLKIRGYKYL